MAKTLDTYSYRNNDTLRDYVDFLSLLGFRLDEDSKAYFVRQSVLHRNPVSTRFSINGIMLNNGARKGLINSKPLEHTFIAMYPSSYHTSQALKNEYERAIKVLDENDGYLLKYLITAPETVDDVAIKELKNLKEEMYKVVFEPNGVTRKDSSIRALSKTLSVLNKNPQYKKISDDCLKHNKRVLREAQSKRKLAEQQVIEKIK